MTPAPGAQIMRALPNQKERPMTIAVLFDCSADTLDQYNRGFDVAPELTCEPPCDRQAQAKTLRPVAFMVGYLVELLKDQRPLPGVQEKIPEAGSMPAPAGAPGFSVKERLCGGQSLSRPVGKDNKLLT